MNVAAIAAWLDVQVAFGCTRIELWQLVQPQLLIGAFEVAGGSRVEEIADQIARVSTIPLPDECVGHALFAYAGNDLKDEAQGLALVREGAFLRPDPTAPRDDERVLAMLLRECEMVARLSRRLDAHPVRRASHRRQRR
jgi:hypothetical protein